MDIKITEKIAFSDILRHNQQLFAELNDEIYLIDANKLGYVLSILGKFGKYIERKTSGNITDWLYANNLLYKEFLTEIGSSKSHHEFANHSKEAQTKLIQDYFDKLIRENIKNIVLFGFLSKNKRKFNTYVNNVLNYILINNLAKSLDMKAFVENLLKIDMLKIAKFYKAIDNMEIIFDILPTKSASETFEMTVKLVELSTKRCQKYINIVKNINRCQFGSELNSLAQMIFDDLNSKSVQNQLLGKLFLQDNFAFLSKEFVFYQCLNDENKKLMKSIFTEQISNLLA